jgi:hypothetical protein
MPSNDDPGEPGARVKFVLFRRWHDGQWNTWTEWEEIRGKELRDKYGETPEIWKKMCKNWIEVGGRYEYRIVRRVDTVEWSLSFKDKPNPEPS